MRIRVRSMLIAIDTLGALCLTGMSAGAFALIYLPMQQRHAELPRLRTELAEARRQTLALAERNQQAETIIAAAEQAVREELAAYLPDEGQIAALVSQVCRVNSVALQSLEPVASAGDATGSHYHLRVRASGPFPKFASVLRNIEASSPYISISDLSVFGPSDDDPAAECVFEWTIRATAPAPNAIAAEGGG